MASTAVRLSEVFDRARHEQESISFNDESKFILFSDCHRGDNGWADDFAHNQILFFHALGWYYANGFSYIELGDGDELWENRDFAEIRRQHSHIFDRMGKFHHDQHLYLIWGNHDIERKDIKTVKRHLHYYEDDRSRKQVPLFPNIVVREGLVLRYEPTGYELFLVHGHQGSLESELLWPISRHFVGRIWKPLQVLGLHDPTRPSQNAKLRHKVETKIQSWIQMNRQPLVCGHTHRSWFPYPGEIPYFNTGSCVHPRCITGIEIQGGTIALIKWWLEPNDTTGDLAVTHKIIAGPERLADYFEIPD